MASMPGQLVFSPFGFLRLAGPILDKELRVMSRGRRLYALRVIYVCLFAAVVLRLWFSTWRSSAGGPGVVQIARLGEMGKQIVATVVWFQFITGQILAAVLLSDAIGQEIRQRTLDSLLVTPVRSFQIVLGKLAGRLLEAASLLAISLPLLAIVRVFGGVPWDYVLAGLCVTLSAGVFAGAFSLLCSISSRDSCHAALTVALWYLVIWGLLPMVLTPLAVPAQWLRSLVMPALHLTNPIAVMNDLTAGMISGGRATPSLAWIWHCLILLVPTTILLTGSTWRVRKIVRRVAPVKGAESAREGVVSVNKRWQRRAIRPVTGSPIIWKERCTALFQTRRRGLFFAGLLVAVMSGVIALFVLERESLYPIVFMIAWFVQMVFLVDLAVAAAGAVTREREAGTWPILLATPLEAGEIIKGKALGVCRRNLPLLLPLPVLFVFAFTLRPLDDKGLWQSAFGAATLAGSLASTTLFLLGAGLYFSARVRTTTMAVTATLVAYLASKFLFFGFFGLFLTVAARMVNALGIRGGTAAPVGAAVIAVVSAVAYAGMGLLFMGLAVGQVRRNVF
jgi:ABC-type transport system involved in multi-copper enzyme maturation permease subunit